MGDTANPNEQVPANAGAKAPAKPRPPAPIFLDKGRDFSTVHGERAPDDKEAAVCFVQDGLPFNAAEELIRDHHTVKGNDKAAKMIEKLAKRAEKRAEREAQRAADLDVEEDEELDAEDDGGEIDLKGWAMGAKRYRWQLVTDAIVMKMGKRITNKRDALEHLIAEGIVQIGQLSAEHKSALRRL